MLTLLFATSAHATCFPIPTGKPTLQFMDAACQPVDLATRPKGVFVLSLWPADHTCCAMEQCHSPQTEGSELLYRTDPATNEWVLIDRTLDGTKRAECPGRPRWLDLRKLDAGEVHLDTGSFRVTGRHADDAGL